MRDKENKGRRKVAFFANTDWYLFNFRLGLAKYLRAKGFDVVMMSPPGEYGYRFSEEGFRWIALPMDRRSLQPHRELFLLYRLRKILKAEAVDAIHNFTIKCVVYGSLAAQAAGVPSRINAVTGLGHVFVSDSLRARLLRPVVNRLLRYSLRGEGSRLVVQNPDDERLFLEQQMIDEPRLRLIKGSGVDTERFQSVPARAGERMRILLAARLLWEKGIEEYAEAARMLRHRKDEVEFLLAGDSDPGNPSAVPDEQIRQWREEDLLTILGHVDDMPSLLREVDLAVLPSYREGVPRGLIEAAAAGLPIVTTDASGCREIVEHEVNGFLVPPRDGRALAKAIERLLDDPNRRKAFGEAGREKVLREFDERIVFERTWQVYESLGLGG
ncbi:MAG TPA: glycosyltransferase family 1 protein [Gammaproteobacteria bacterium]|nr:glycosyltransferase family 1 protein [Gammaproteobacteria bacterium]